MFLCLISIIFLGKMWLISFLVVLAFFFSCFNQNIFLGFCCCFAGEKNVFEIVKKSFFLYFRFFVIYLQPHFCPLVVYFFVFWFVLYFFFGVGNFVVGFLFSNRFKRYLNFEIFFLVVVVICRLLLFFFVLIFVCICVNKY